MAIAEVSVVECPKDTHVEGGVSLAVLGLSVDELAQRSGLTWHEDHDELDAFRFAVARPTHGSTPFVLVGYEHDPSGTVTVMGNPAAADAGELDELLAGLGVRRDELLNPTAETPVDAARSLELVRDAEQAQVQIARQLEAISALTASLQRGLARELAAKPASRTNVPEWLPKLLAQGRFTELTPAQQRVVQFQVQGFTVREIAERVHVSDTTVKRTLAAARHRLAGTASPRSQAQRRKRRSRTTA